MLEGLSGVKGFEHKKMLFLRLKADTKKMAGKMASNDINARLAANVFDGGKRLQNDELWTAYSAGKQTAAQLAKQYGCGSKTIYRRLRWVQIRSATRCPKKPTSSWIPHTSGAVSA